MNKQSNTQTTNIDISKKKAENNLVEATKDYDFSGRKKDLETIFSEQIAKSEDSIFLMEYDFDYNEKERKNFWTVTNLPMIKRRTLLFSAVCVVIGILLFFTSRSFGVTLALIILGIVWTGMPCFLYYVKYWKYCKKTKKLWGHKWHIVVYDDSIEMNREKSETEKLFQKFNYDDFYKIVNIDSRLYLVAGTKSIIIFDKNKTYKELIDAFLELNLFIQNGARE